jgi:hypothetical protein
MADSTRHYPKDTDATSDASHFTGPMLAPNTLDYASQIQPAAREYPKGRSDLPNMGSSQPVPAPPSPPDFVSQIRPAADE